MDRCRTGDTGVRLGNGPLDTRTGPTVVGGWSDLALDSIRAHDTRGRLGRLAVLPARLAFRCHAPGLDAVEAEIEPAGKVAYVKKLRAEGQHVAMAGDGINDAPALSEAEVGIAMGTGTDVAMQSAGITLVKGDLRDIAKAIRLSRATMWNIRENLVFAFLYNALGIPVAAGVLYPFFGLLLSPMIAGAAMSLSSVSVIGNALRLRNVKMGASQI